MLTLEKVEQVERLVPDFTWAQLQEIKTKIITQSAAGAGDLTQVWTRSLMELLNVSTLDLQAHKHFYFGKVEMWLAIDHLSNMFDAILINLREIQHGHTYPNVNDHHGIPVYNCHRKHIDPYWPLGKRTKPPEWVCVRLDPTITHISQSLMFEKPHVVSEHLEAALPEFPQTVLELMRRVNAVIGPAIHDYDSYINYYLLYKPDWKPRGEITFPTEDPILFLNIPPNFKKWDAEIRDFRYIEDRQLLIGRWGDDQQLPGVSTE